MTATLLAPVIDDNDDEIFDEAAGLALYEKRKAEARDNVAAILGPPPA